MFYTFDKCFKNVDHLDLIRLILLTTKKKKKKKKKKKIYN